MASFLWLLGELISLLEAKIRLLEALEQSVGPGHGNDEGLDALGACRSLT
jgi:hypothetical protein